MSGVGQNRPFRPVALNDSNTLKSGNQEPERRLTTAKRKSPHVFPDFRLVPKPEVAPTAATRRISSIKTCFLLVLHVVTKHRVDSGLVAPAVLLKELEDVIVQTNAN